jgi:hypothetical protein
MLAERLPGVGPAGNQVMLNQNLFPLPVYAISMALNFTSAFVSPNGKRRIRAYLEQTQPLIEYYRQKDVLVEVNGKSSIDQVTADLLTAIHGKSKS